MRKGERRSAKPHGPPSSLPSPLREKTKVSGRDPAPPASLRPSSSSWGCFYFALRSPSLRPYFRAPILSFHGPFHVETRSTLCPSPRACLHVRPSTQSHGQQCPWQPQPLMTATSLSSLSLCTLHSCHPPPQKCPVTSQYCHLL